MNVEQLLQTNYIDEFKQGKVIFRKYSDLGLLIVKRKYGSGYSDETPWLNNCRGLIINYKDHTIVFRPPVKAIEILTKDVFLEKVDTSYELLDGTMINLFYFAGKWVTSTRSNIGCTNKWSQDMNFLQMFQECSLTLNYETLHKEYTYSFVMRHTKNRHTSIVDTNELVLVDIYQGSTRMNDLPENDGYRVIRKSSTINGLQKGLTGYKDGIRYKWLTTEHKFIDMIKPNTNNPCLNYLTLRNSGHLTNYLKLYPEYRFQYDGFRKRVHSISQLLYQYYISVFVKKEVSKNEIPFALKPLIYEIHGQYLRDKQSISWTDIKQYMYELEPKRLQFVINKL